MMAEFAPTHPLGDISTIEKAEITCAVRPVTFAAQLFASAGKADAFAKRVGATIKPGLCSANGDLTLMPLAPGQWMAISQKSPAPKLADLEKKIGKLGYASQQTDARICIRVSGPKARELMSRGCRLDLHPDVTGKGFCAQTPMAQVGVLLNQVDDMPVYDLYLYSGFARSFWHWLEQTAAQF